MLKANDIFSIYRIGNAHIVRAILAAVGVLTAVLLASNSGVVTAAQHKPTQKALVDGPRADMIRALRATGPHPSLGDQARVFDRFVGTWDFDCVLYSADGTVVRFPGEWIFGWVLDGRALQDVWIGYQNSRSPGERGIGTTLRFYDAKAAQWHIMFVVPGPSSGKTLNLRGGAEGDRIVLMGNDTDGSLLRWSFNAIQPNSFLWLSETSPDGGKTWRLEQEMRLRRRTAH